MFLEKQATHWKLKAQLVGMLFLAILGLPATTSADVVTDWNQIALNTASAISPQFPQQTRGLAMGCAG